MEKAWLNLGGHFDIESQALKESPFYGIDIINDEINIIQSLRGFSIKPHSSCRSIVHKPTMATNAGKGAAKQLASARTATAYMKVLDFDSLPICNAERYRNTLFKVLVYGIEYVESSQLIRTGQAAFH